MHTTEDISAKLRELEIEKYYPNFAKKLKENPLYNHDLYGAVDSCLGNLGIAFYVDLIFKGEKLVGYQPYLKFYPYNKFGEPSQERLIYDSSNYFKERGDAYKFLLKEILNSIEYRLGDV
ncbi:MAG: hypothetical protein ACK4TA_07100 [Saprospiraceae bacterium]